MPITAIVQTLQIAFEAQRNPARAADMSAYMRSQFAFVGLPTPLRRELARPLTHARHDRATLLSIAHQLYSLPEREYRYAAIDLLARQHRQLMPDDIPTLIALVLQQPWWDTVDSLSGVIGDILLAQTLRGDRAVPRIEAALLAPSFWERRIAMLHQLGWKQHTDPERLWRYALHLAPEGEFFIRKAIGWALRDYARTAPEAVSAFLLAHRAQLSALTVREAGKHLPPLPTRLSAPRSAA